MWESLLGVTRPPPSLGTQGSVCQEASDPDTGLGFLSAHSVASGTQQPLDCPQPRRSDFLLL